VAWRVGEVENWIGFWWYLGLLLDLGGEIADCFANMVEKKLGEVSAEAACVVKWDFDMEMLVFAHWDIGLL
jgi:hypothetical protein